MYLIILRMALNSNSKVSHDDSTYGVLYKCNVQGKQKVIVCKRYEHARQTHRNLKQLNEKLELEKTSILEYTKMLKRYLKSTEIRRKAKYIELVNQTPINIYVYIK